MPLSHAIGDRAKAGEAFQKLQAMDPSSAASAKMLGQLARASAQRNPQQALALSGNLPPLPKLTGLDLDDLENKVAGELCASKCASKLARHKQKKQKDYTFWLQSEAQYHTRLTNDYGWT